MMVPLPDPSKGFEAQEPAVLLAMCLWGEARGEIFQAKLAVGAVIRNRVARKGKYGEGYAGVILRPWQFSSFNANDPNRTKLSEPLKHDSEAVWALCYSAALATLNGSEDATASAVFYHDATLLSAPREWGAVSFTTRIGRLRFYRDAGAAAQR